MCGYYIVSEDTTFMKRNLYNFFFQTSRTALQEAVHREYTEIVTMLIKAQSAADERVRRVKKQCLTIMI